ncbi:MAG: Rrf2 family transcriptional regulator [Gammaproteobacteria bacterium]|nr:Rrf2 family transcriptional regulator [Gammaproteobacteria bacterium]
MKLTTKGRYAVTAMLDLAIHYHDGPVSLADIAQRQCISLSYLEQLFTRLRKQGLVRSTRGPGGGYTLGRAPSEIAIADVVTAVNEKTDSTRCGGSLNCQNDQRCLTHTLWEALSLRIHEFLSRISLAELMAREDIMKVAMRQDRTLGHSHVHAGRVRERAGA